MTYCILIAEDDPDIVEILKLYLESSGYQVLSAGDGREAYGFFSAGKIDLAVLDLMMPEMNGYDLIKKIRQKSNIPIIILSAKSEDKDKILGLNIGADDYLTKPFNPLEVVARVESSLRRYYQLGAEKKSSSRGILKVGSLVMDTDRISVEKDGQPVSLTLTEFKILQILMRSPGQIFTKAQLYERINGVYFEADDNTMMVHISNLRDKIEDDSKHPRYIKTLRGAGYKIEKSK